MKKKGFIGRLAAVAVVLCLITMSLTSGTLARYASSVDGNATATVAAWKIAFKDGTNDFSTTKTVALKPDKTKFVDTGLVVDNKVAPEIMGSLTLEVDGTGTEVAFDYTIELDLGNIKKGDTATTNCPLKFYSDATCATPLDTTGNKVSVSDTVYANATGENAQKKTVTVYWKWDTTSTTDDATDTALGVESVTNSVVFSIPVTIKATQTLTAPATP